MLLAGSARWVSADPDEPGYETLEERIMQTSRLEVPTLLVRPDFQGLADDPTTNYMDAYTRISWDGAPSTHDAIREVVLTGVGVVPWADRPDEVDGVVRDFLADLARSPPPAGS